MQLDKRPWMEKAPTVYYKISFSFKDGKMKIQASQFMVSLLGNEMPFDKMKDRAMSKKDRDIQYSFFDDKFNALISSVTDAAKKDDNW